MFVAAMFLFAWIATMQCTAIANPVLCPYGSVTESHEGLRLRQRKMLSHAAGLMQSAAEQGEDALDKKPAADAANRIQALLDDFENVRKVAEAAEQEDNARAVKAKGEVEKAEKEFEKNKDTSTASSYSRRRAQTPVFQWDEAFIKTAKSDVDSLSQKAVQAKSKADEVVKIAKEALQKLQSIPKPDEGTGAMTEQEYKTIEESIKDAKAAIMGISQQADAAEVAEYYVKTMLVSHSVFKTVENITYMNTKTKTLIKEAESGIKEAVSYLDLIPREYVPEVKKFMVSIGALINPLKELQATSGRAVHHANALQAIITDDKERIKSMTSVQEAKCTWGRASRAAGFVDEIADPVKKRTPFLNEAIKQGDEAKAKGSTAKIAYSIWYWSSSTETINQIKAAVAKEKEEEEKLKKESGAQIPPTPPVTDSSEPLTDFSPEVTLPDCNALGSEKIQTVDLGAPQPESDREDSTASAEGDGQKGDAKASDASGNDGERKGDKGESFGTKEQPSSGGDVPTKKPVDDEDIRPADSTESNEFGGNGSSTHGPRRGGHGDRASTLPSTCAYALLTLIMFLMTVQR